MTPDDVVVPSTDRLVPYEMTVEPMSVAGLAYARDGVVPPSPTGGDEVPWAFFTLLRSQFRLGGSLHELMGRDPRRGLMVGIEYAGARQCKIGERVAAEPSLASQRTVERDTSTLILTAVTTRWSSAGENRASSDEWLLEEVTTMADLFGHAEPPSPRPPRVVGDRTELGPISRLRIAWACVATEDLQEVHHDPSMARARGYDDVLVPGTLLAAIAEAHLRAALDSVDGFRIRFTAPVYPDDHLSFTLQPGGAEREFEFTTTRAGTPTVVAHGRGSSRDTH